MRIRLIFSAKNVANLSANLDCDSCVGSFVLLFLLRRLFKAANNFFVAVSNSPDFFRAKDRGFQQDSRE